MRRITSKPTHVETDAPTVASLGIRMPPVTHFTISPIPTPTAGTAIFPKPCKILLNMMISELRKTAGINNCKTNVPSGVWKSIWFSGRIITMSPIVSAPDKINVILIANSTERFSSFVDLELSRQ